MNYMNRYDRERMEDLLARERSGDVPSNVVFGILVQPTGWNSLDAHIYLTTDPYNFRHRMTQHLRVRVLGSILVILLVLLVLTGLTIPG